MQSQSVFRAVLGALARPGRIARLSAPLAPPAPMLPTTAAVLLSLTDFETTVWFDAPATDAANFVRFHAGARLVDNPVEADFAVITDPQGLPPHGAFKLGTPDYPDRSTTLLLQVEAMTASGLRFEGPGIDGTVSFGITPEPDGFASWLKCNHGNFPRGVDIVFLTADHIAALPRSSRQVEV
jgi:alpha-D-ribose 1-methylphosphonate 5-triphosphate synthase subunit PhnH